MQLYHPISPIYTVLQRRLSVSQSHKQQIITFINYFYYALYKRNRFIPDTEKNTLKLEKRSAKEAIHPNDVHSVCSVRNVQHGIQPAAAQNNITGE